ncbi:hypothetical protein C8J56DRAFT_783192 [Mycena floridula]|nr:hypothetical protein C8J56DRAFT_783192 [Mycena floridula]
MKDEEYEDDELISSDEDDNEPGQFKLRGQLPKPQTLFFSIDALHEKIHHGLIDLNPPWQRDVVWTEPKQVLLIESIFLSYYVPPVVFATVDQEGEEVLVCVDGKQRLTAIQKFVDGQIYYRDRRTNQKWWWTSPPTKSRTTKLILPENVKTEFKSKLITCVQYDGLKPGLERGIFTRIQLGMPLSTAEKLQAVSSDWSVFVQDLLMRHVEVEGGLKQQLRWNTKRAMDFLCVAQMVYGCDNANLEPIPVGSKMHSWLESEGGPAAQFKADINEALNTFYEIATNPDLNDGFTKINKPASLIFLFPRIMTYLLREETIEFISLKIFEMRKSIRASFPDVRMNTRCGAAMWKFINKVQAACTDNQKRKHDEDDEKDYRPRKKKAQGK